MLTGTTMPATKVPKIIVVLRQPTASMSHWVRGIMKTVPRAMPAVAIEMARPRCATNHFASGTCVSSCPAAPAPNPARPENAKIA